MDVRMLRISKYTAACEAALAAGCYPGESYFIQMHSTARFTGFFSAFQHGIVNEKV